MIAIAREATGQRRRALQWVLRAGVASFVCASASAHGQPPESPSARAATLFDEGRALTSAGELEGACRKFAESQALEPRVGTLLNLAGCEENRGQLLMAAAHWAECAALAERTGDDRRGEALGRGQKLEARIPKLVVRLMAGAPPDAAARLEKVGAEAGDVVAFGSDMRLDPAGYRVLVTASGRQDRSYEFVLAESMRKVLDVEAGPRLAGAQPEPLLGTDAASHATESSSDGAWSPWRTAGVAAGVTGVVSLGIGAALGLVAMSKQGDAEEHCNEANYCDGDGLDLRDDAISMARGSTATFVIGGVLAAAGIVMIVAAPSDESATEPRAEVAMGPTGLVVRGRW